MLMRYETSFGCTVVPFNHLRLLFGNAHIGIRVSKVKANSHVVSCLMVGGVCMEAQMHQIRILK